MKTAEFTYLLKNPEAISSGQVDDIRTIIDEFPYFQPARALYLKALKNEESYRYNQELKTTAAYSTDRSVLFDFITTDDFDQNAISDEIKRNIEALREIEIHDYEEIQASQKTDGSKTIVHPSDSSGIAADRIAAFPEPELEEKPEPADITETKGPEEVLELGKPLEFDRNEIHSFSEWLKITSFKPIKRDVHKKAAIREEKQEDKNKKMEAIDRFIETNPKIIPAPSEGKQKNLAKAQMLEPESLMTETLARIYLEQNNFKKAIQAYKILSLKYPEKSGFFADQIQAIKELQQNKPNS